MSVKQIGVPDGGYGWIIVMASAGNYFINIPLLQTLGLLFKDEFQNIGLSATQGSLIINLNSAFGMMTGLFNGTLLKYYGYRKIAYLGALLITFGIILTSTVKSFAGYIIYYGLITSFGYGLSLNSYNLAVNTYFKEKRSKALSIMMTFTGFGPVFLPLLVNFLILHYDTAGVTLIIGGVCAHGFITATLLQPVKKHMLKTYVNDKKIAETIIPEEDDTDINNLKEEDANRRDLLHPEKENTISKPLNLALGASISLTDLNRSTSNLSQTKTQWWRSMSTINLESSVNLFGDKITIEDKDELQTTTCEKDVKNNSTVLSEIINKLVDIFDLDLLRDITFCNILVGMSLAVFAELNFSVLTAFILSDLSLTTNEIATFMSLMGAADLVFRFLGHYIGDYLKQPPRVMYLFTLFGLIITRMGFIIFTSFYALLGVAVLLGFAKGVRTVYLALILPTYVPLQKLPSASGLQMMLNGLFIIIGGPIIGLIRDITGSYYLCIIIMNLITLFTIILWTIEIIYKKYLAKQIKIEESLDNVILS